MRAWRPAAGAGPHKSSAVGGAAGSRGVTELVAARAAQAGHHSNACALETPDLRA